MPSRRGVLRRGAGLFVAGSAAGVGALAVRSNADDTNADGQTASDGSAADADGPTDRERGRATVLVAGSLQQIATKVGAASVEAHGSVACRRLLEDGLRDPDAVALADPRLFSGLTDRVTCFATNALVVALREDLADEYDDWRALVSDSDRTLGRTDPERDPLGYRTVMALRLADRNGGGIDAEAVLDRTNVFPETGLLRTLEAGGIDAAFAYRNMAVEHDLPSLALPDRIDFSNPEFADDYARASVELNDRTVTGAPIRYAANARTPRGEEWVEKLTGAIETLETRGFGIPDSYPRQIDVSE
ncbi:substrate-binding domain-containing protein [Halorussus ruber]|uniref:substrate-binding domain-containing protein n=1 Tax=Halorussus ruber TaxID=1126238 RepID=UPI0010923BDB|nr:substrate-binding domain-containing protein [Halorussus ruber]